MQIREAGWRFFRVTNKMLIKCSQLNRASRVMLDNNQAQRACRMAGKIFLTLAICGVPGIAGYIVGGDSRF